MATLAEMERAFETLPLADQEELLKRLSLKLGFAGKSESSVREEHVRLLDERFAAYRDDPGQASAWEDVKRRFASVRRK